MKVEKRDDVTIIVTEERVDTLEGPKLRDVVEQLAKESGLRLVLDMGGTRL